MGTNFGGDGRTTFGLPDLQGRTPSGYGSGAGLQTHNLASRGGAEQIQVTTGNMPSHTHGVQVQSTAGTVRTPVDNILAREATGAPIYAPVSGADGNLAGIQNTGGSQPINYRSPFLALSFQLAMTGIFPSRN
mgnify:CR=1 FL=1